MITRTRFFSVHHSRSARSGPPPDPPPPPAPSSGLWWQLVAVAVLLGGLVVALALQTPTSSTLTYSDFVDRVDAGTVEQVTIDDKGSVYGTLSDGTEFVTQLPTALDLAGLDNKLQAKQVRVSAEQTDDSPWGAILFSMLPFVVFAGLLLWLGRRAQRAFSGGAGGIGGIGTFGRSKARVIEANRPTTRFADVAGYDGVKQEISEVVDFLRDPEKYAAAGAKGPRGVLMIGPPGTGKTLLARAVAGEAEVRFLSVTGSEFVEMFVGVGASRVRDLFEQARKSPPSIIFIDEIDAIGSKRGVGTYAGNDEREQTLNQLLAEMDGFDQSVGIVVLAATNRPEALDPALLRPGRFDRTVVIPLPTQSERAAILSVHLQGKHLGPDVDLSVLARATPGFSGADLANLVNEAAINAVRDDRTVICADDLSSARDRLLLGRRESANALLPEERTSVAVHESGHALLAALCPHADPVAKVTILPAGMALGSTQQLPEVERHLYSEGYLNDLLTVRVGGRAAEIVVFGEGSTGAADDLSGATRIAVRMVREFGLSAAFGPVGYGSGDPNYLHADTSDRSLVRPYSEHTQQLVDREVARLLRAAEERAVALLTQHRTALDRLAAILVEEETVDGDVVLDVLRAEADTARPQRLGST
ncbi:ATP-dependent zinc metalloprotease FtsH [Rhodococcus aetherivorans]|uniref:ATP-dependent zinc metalloprotease FtsH n=1 Tax=Rhodococcus aetherivorans TaxID=191292 RepID=UPI0036AB75A3